MRHSLFVLLSSGPLCAFTRCPNRAQCPVPPSFQAVRLRRCVCLVELKNGGSQRPGVDLRPVRCQLLAVALDVELPSMAADTTLRQEGTAWASRGCSWPVCGGWIVGRDIPARCPNRAQCPALPSFQAVRPRRCVCPVELKNWGHRPGMDLCPVRCQLLAVALGVELPSMAADALSRQEGTPGPPGAVPGPSAGAG